MCRCRSCMYPPREQHFCALCNIEENVCHCDCDGCMEESDRSTTFSLHLLPAEVVAMILSYDCIRYAGAVVRKTEPDTYKTQKHNYIGTWRTVVAYPHTRAYSVTFSSSLQYVALQPLKYEPTIDFTITILRILGNLCQDLLDHTLAFNPGLPDVHMASITLCSSFNLFPFCCAAGTVLVMRQHRTYWHVGTKRSIQCQC